MEDHAAKESVLFEAFKQRLGTSSKHDMKFSLQNIIKKSEGLEELTVPFTRQEIDLVIKEMPTDHAPGPDGFNGSFLKTCCPMIKEDSMFFVINSLKEDSILKASTMYILR